MVARPDCLPVMINSIQLTSPSKSAEPHLAPDAGSTVEHNVKGLLAKVNKIPAAGIFMAALSGIFFATGSLFVKLVKDINAVEIVVIRSFIQLIVYGIVIFIQKSSLLGVKNERIALFARAFFGFLSVGGAYYSFQKIPLGDASSIVFSSPIFVTVFACVLLGESLTIFKIFTLCLGLIGIALICKPSFLFGNEITINDEDRILGSISAIFACLSASMVFIFLRKLRKTPSAVSIFWLSVYSIIAGTAILLFWKKFDIPTTIEAYLILIGNGICGVCGQFLITVSLKIEDAGPVSFARTIDIVMAFVYQIFILNQEVQITSLIGAILICFGVIAHALNKWITEKKGLFALLTCRKQKEKQSKPGSISSKKSVEKF